MMATVIPLYRTPDARGDIVRILLAWGCEGERGRICQGLDSLGYDVCAVGTADRALDLLTCGVWPIAIFDQDLPDMPGLQVASLLKFMAASGRRDLDSVHTIVCGRCLNKADEEATSTVERWLGKPVSPTDIIAAVADLIPPKGQVR